MSSKDIAELFSQYKTPELMSVQQFAACYIDGAKEKTVMTPPRKLLTMEEAEINEYSDMIKKVLRPKDYGDRILNAKVNSIFAWETLKPLIDSGMKDQAAVEKLMDAINAVYSSEAGYAVFLFYSAYDVEDNNGGDSEEVYKHIIGVICQGEAEEPGMVVTYDGFKMKERRLVLRAPDTAFIYPAFINHSADTSQITLFNADPLDMQEGIISEFTTERPIPTSEYMDDVYNAVWAAYHDKKTVERITDEFAFRMSLWKEEPKPVTVDVARQILEYCGCTDLTMVCGILQKSWYIIPSIEQLKNDKMVKRYRKRSAHEELVRTLEYSRALAELAGNEDLRQQLEEQISKEKMNG